MGILTLQCNTCRRQKDVQEITHGVNLTTKCTITDGCRGQMHVKERHPDLVRPRQLDLSSQTWSKRDVLHTHTQRIASTQWRISHNITSPHSVLIEVNGDILSEDQYTVHVPTPTTTVVTFNAPVVGIAQLVSRNGSPRTVTDIGTGSSSIQVTTSGTLILLDRQVRTAATNPYDVVLTLPTGQTFDLTVLARATDIARTQWRDAAVAIIRETTEHRVFGLSATSIFEQLEMEPVIGSTLTFLTTNGAPIAVDMVHLGLSTPTLSSEHVFSKRKDVTVDLARWPTIIYSSGEWVTDINALQTHVPPVRVLRYTEHV